jgi:hypothetical protein
VRARLSQQAGWLLAAVPFVLFILLPVLIVPLVSGPEDDAFAAQVEVVEELGTTQEGKLQFSLVRLVDGPGPAEQFVVTLDVGYTQGASGHLRPGDVLWVDGTLMDPETYFGEQYLFFGYPQLYLSQVKTGPWWPSQASDLRALYLSPVVPVTSLFLVWIFPFMEEFEIGVWLRMIARVAVVVGAVILAVRWRKRPARLVAVIGTYLVVAVLLTLPAL